MQKQIAVKIREEVDNDYNLVATGGLSFIMTEYHEIFHQIGRKMTMDGIYLR